MMKIPPENIRENIDKSFKELKAFENDFKMEIIAHTQLLEDITKIGSILKPHGAGGIFWSRLKHFAMKKNYPRDKLHIDLLPEEKEKLELLIIAQKAVGIEGEIGN